MKLLKNTLLSFLFPPYCVLCGTLLPTEQWQKDLCSACEKEIPFLQGNKQCSICGRTFHTGELCPSCYDHKPVYQKSFSAFPYDLLREEIARFKFQGAGHDGEALGRLMASYLFTYQEDSAVWADFITEVPLHPKKERERGYNQASLLCRSLAQATGIAYRPAVLKRQKYTTPQSELAANKRRQNLKDAFVAEDCHGCKVLLVDDILTTGSTVDECARTLYRQGAAEVRVFCLSAAVEHSS